MTDELLKECEPFLKEGETPAQCIKRNRKDVSMLLKMLAEERKLVEQQAHDIDVLFKEVESRPLLSKDSGNG